MPRLKTTQFRGISNEPTTIFRALNSANKIERCRSVYEEHHKTAATTGWKENTSKLQRHRGADLIYANIGCKKQKKKTLRPSYRRHGSDSKKKRVHATVNIKKNRCNDINRMPVKIKIGSRPNRVWEHS